MGTRSLVGVMHGTVCKSVYCHYDGYLSYTGEILNKHYDSTLANALVARGDNSGVKPTLDEISFYEDRQTEGEDVKEFINSTPWQVAHTFDEFLDQVHGCCAEYYYVMKEGVWYAGAVYDTPGLAKGKLVPLEEALAQLAIEQLIADES
jgi:hypothetical protein